MPLSRTFPAALALTTAATLAATLAAVVGPAAADRAHVRHRATTSISVTGRGYGHGHGLSQWGAEGAAAKGLSARKILDFYYPTLKPGTAGGNVSVLITGDTSADVVVSDRSGLRATSLQGGRTFRLTRKNAVQWRLTPAGGGARTAISYRTSVRGAWHQLRTVPGEAQLDAGGAPLTLHSPHGVSVAYRGALRSADGNASGSERDTVNVLPLESYLKGVVPREAYPSWHPAALQAQAVAARTYAAFERAQPLTTEYQICDTSLCQVYGGYSSEVSTTSRAVDATRRQILTHAGKPAFTQFSASNGGWMAAGSEPYLVAKQDPYDTKYRGWHASVSARAVEKAFPAIGAFRSAKILTGDGHGQWHGRVETMRLTGSQGSTTISGDTFRSDFGLMSSWFTLG